MLTSTSGGDSVSPPGTLPQLLAYFLRLGTTGFGGPIALVGYMQRDLVDARGWITEREYTDGLALAQLAPGPLAAQLAMYLGWVRARAIGALLVALAFIGPSFLMVLALSVLYLEAGGLSWMTGAFYGIAAAVTVIMARSAVKLVRMTLKRDWILWAAFAINAIVTVLYQAEVLWVLVTTGLLVAASRAPLSFAQPSRRWFLVVLPTWLISGARGPATTNVLWEIGSFFTQAGAVVFGSGLAVIPFLYGGVVHRFQWLTEQQFLDAVAVSMITPGPVVITVAFIGYLTAGPLGALIAAFAVFLPVYLIVVLLAPHFHRVANSAWAKGLIAGVTAGATGAIAGATLVLSRRAITDFTTGAIAAVTLAGLLTFRRIPEPVVILAAGVAGIWLRP